jgi:dipeptidyl aminopeptidase/acylaminoacyl peptidase
MYNKRPSHLTFAVLLMTALLSLMTSTIAMAKSPSVPLKQFYQMPMVESPTISPNGNNIAVILNQGEDVQVAVVPFNDKSKVKVLLKLGAEKYRIDNIYWANDSVILVSVTMPFRIDEYRYRTTHLYSARIDGSNVFEIRKKQLKKSPSLFYYNSPTVLSLLEDEPNHILVTIRDPRANNMPWVYKVNVFGGDFEKYQSNSNRIVGWYPTPSGEILMSVGIDDNPDTEIRYVYIRKNTDADWQRVKTIEAYKTETFTPIQYEPKTNSIIVLSDHVQDKAEPRKVSMWRYDVTSGKFTERMGLAPGNFDVTSAITRLEGKARKVIGFTYNDNFSRSVYFDKGSNSLSQQFKGLFAKSGLQGGLIDWNQTRSRFIAASVSDDKPLKYYLFDMANKKIVPWYGQYPELEKAPLAKVTPFDFKARDGMDLHGFLTLPNDVKNPPVVLFPHGGPFARDSQYFDRFVQMFASRGYAVLQVNFRGSRGYGNAYETAGYLQWGKKMQTDLIDALDWVKSSKQANADKACIVGGSYGGYAALAAGYQTPDRFKCIISFAGISNLELAVRHMKLFGHGEYVDNAVSEDVKVMQALSPMRHAKEFKAPVLLIHGRVDKRVRYEQSEYMYDALKYEKKAVEYELLEWGTHNFDDAGSLQKTMELMAGFLDKHLQ